MQALQLAERPHKMALQECFLDLLILLGSFGLLIFWDRICCHTDRL